MQARYPATRMGVEDVIREAFNEAKAYKAEWDDYNAEVARGEHPIPPRKDLKLEPLKEVLEGKRYVHAHCYRADEILMLIRVADDYGFKIRTFQHVLEGYKVAKEIAAHGAGGSTFSDWWAYKMEAFDAIPYNAALMTKKGVVVSLNSDDAELMRHLNTEAAKAMKYGGATETEALAMVTINPGQATGHRQSRRLDRGRQGRRPGDLRQVPAVGFRQGAEGADRRHGVFRPRQGSQRAAGQGSRRSRSWSTS